MCMHWTTCLCWKDTKSPALFIAAFAMVTSLMQIAISIAVFTGMAGVNMQLVTNPLYIALAVADFIVVLKSTLLIIALERSDACHRWVVHSWVIWMLIYILYESAINIFVFTVALNNPGMAAMFPKGPVIVFIVYWIVKVIILFTGWLFIVSHLCYSTAMPVNNYYGGDTTVEVVSKEPVQQPMPCSHGGMGVMNPVQFRSSFPPAVASNFDVIRPTSNGNVYCSRGNCGAAYQNNYNMPTRFM